LIIVRLNGGLGNQIFQYAAAYSLAIKNQDVLKIDLNNQSTSSYGLELMNFNIRAQIASSEEVKSLRSPYGAFSSIKRIINQKVLKRYFHDWHPEIMTLTGDIYLDGYFQSNLYFSKVRDQLFKEITLNRRLLNNCLDICNLINSEQCPVSVHLRRGDYVNNSRNKVLHDICTPEYFYAAIKQIESDFTGVTLCIFSDDVEWVKKNYAWKLNTIFISDKLGKNRDSLSASEELFLMSNCHHNIISNSTFSWWGAYLNQNKKKKVIAPNLWNRSQIFKHKNIIPIDWIQIPV
jgi:hypothetical protein|tara:strand:- start:5 stop:877 length:873 start_codon:yes stop_codon:yes gene_type:complete